MGEFRWVHIGGELLTGAVGPQSGNVQLYKTDTSLTASSNFYFDIPSKTLYVTGTLDVSGTINSNQYNVNVVDKTVSNISATGSTKFGDTADDTHKFKGHLGVSGSLSAYIHDSLAVISEDVTVPAGYNWVMYGPSTIASGVDFIISSGANLKIKPY